MSTRTKPAERQETKLHDEAAGHPSMRSRVPLLVGAAAVVITLVVDQALKEAVFAGVRPGEELSLAPLLSILPSWNPGTAFGFAHGAAPQLLIALAMGISAWLAFLMLKSRSRVEAAALGATIGGALANVVDRVRFDAVRDFIDVHWSALHWPTFDAADMFVVGGLLLFAATDIHRQRNARRSSARQEPSKTEGTHEL